MFLQQIHSPDVITPPASGIGAPFLSLKLEDVIKHHVLMVYRKCDGNKVQTAKVLCVSRSALYGMLRGWGQV